MHRAILFALISFFAARYALAATPSEQINLENRFDALIHPDDLRDWMKLMASEPNHVGSPHDKANADYQLKLFKSWGWDAHIESFDVLYPTPISETLELIGPKRFKASFTEPPIAGDATSAKTAGALPGYLVYAADGDVTGEVVYVNFGMPDDYKELEQLGISPKGKIVIARYGDGWRGLKVKLAQEHGAIGCIIYSDPADDGYALGDVYPAGPMRPPHGIQRGSVLDMLNYPGDPLTPGIGATKGATRLKVSEAPTILKIPAVPISYADAQVFLENIAGPVAPGAWRGALPITYHVGPSRSAVHLAVKSDWSLKPIYDVIAVMKGFTYPNQWVIRGNHHDGWVFGATDPLSAQVALMAEAKAIGGLVQNGWRPKRTLVYASWDAEEPFLLGSTEWEEVHADELKRNTVLYVNSDLNGRGFLRASGSHDFQHLVNQVANDVVDPETGVSIAERLRARARLGPRRPGANPSARGDRDFPITPLGAHSDYSPFIQHLGVPTLDLSFGGESNSNGTYHSAYDTFEHHSRFIDPGFVYDALLAKTIGRVILRASESDLPLQRPSDFAATVSTYLDEIKRLANTMRDDAVNQENLLRDHVYQLAADPSKPGVLPSAPSKVPQIAFAPLESAVDRLTRSAQAYDEAFAKNATGLSPERLARVQNLMLTIDQTLAPEVGLPGRPWYKSLIYAPGRLTGYSAKTLPGVREAIEEGRWAEADSYAKLTADALNAYSDRLDQASAVLSGA